MYKTLINPRNCIYYKTRKEVTSNLLSVYESPIKINIKTFYKMKPLKSMKI